MPIASPLSFEKFDDWAEDTFQSSGSGSAVTVNPTRRDERGWDFIVEWDETPNAKIPRDRQVIARTARIQIKSCRQSRPTFKLKLSNALRFVEANEPCFVVLYWLDKKNGVEIYVRHFDVDLIAIALKRAREADRDGKTDYHRIFLYITMGNTDLHTDDVIPWLKSFCKDKPADYAKKKSKVRDSVGGRGLVGTIRLPTNQIISLVEHAVGLRQDYRPDWIELRETRFGIPASTSEVEGQPDSFNLRVPERPSAIHFESASGEVVAFKGVTKAFSVPGYSGVDLIAAFSTKHLTARVYASGKMETNYSLKSGDVEEIRELCDLMVLFCMFGTGPMFVTYELEGNRLERGNLSKTEKPEQHDLFLWARDRLDALLITTRASEHPRLSILNMLDVAGQVDLFYRCVMADSATLKLIPKHDAAKFPEPIGMIGFCYVQIAGVVFAAFYRQAAASKVIKGEKTIITFGKPKLIERWAKGGTLIERLPDIRRKFNSIRTKAPRGTIYFDEGDMMSAVQGATDIDMVA